MIVFFGLGAVGATMLTCLAELAERDGTTVRFLVFVHHPDAARDALFHAERYFDRVDFVGLSDFAPVFAQDPAHAPLLADAWFLVNAALPALNRPMLGLAAALGLHAVDLASGMNKPRRIEEYLRTGVIRRAHFSAAAEIRISEVVRNDRQTLIETVGLSYERYRGLLDTPYTGATYISYPTGVGAAILAWHALEYERCAPGSLVGVLTAEDLAAVLPRDRIDAIRRDLVAWDIDLFESVRDASSS